MNRLCRGAIVTAMVLGSMGCKRIEGGAADGGVTFPAGSGLAAAGNDPAVLAVVKGIITSCGTKWDASKGWPDDCMKPYNDLKVDNKDTTFVNLMEDPDAKVRELGVQGLDRFGYNYRRDTALGPRVVAALEREPALPFNSELAYLADNVDLSVSPDVGARIKAVALSPKTPNDVKIVIMVWWPENAGSKSPLAYDVLKANIAATDKKMKIGALDGYASFDDTKHDEACAYWAANMTNADDDIAGVAYGHLTHGWSGVNAHDADSDWYISGGGQAGDNRCTQVDAAIALAETKAKAGKLNSSNFVYGLSFVAKDKKATPAQKKAAITALRTDIETKGNETRSQAVNALVEADPGEKSFIEKFKTDPDISFAVKDALERKH